MDRRQFLAAGTGLALSSAFAQEFDKEKRRRVGLIGTGWYGKADLFRLIQVAPVEVVSLCDVDKEMLENAANMVATRQASKKKPRTFHDYRDMLKEKDLEFEPADAICLDVRLQIGAGIMPTSKPALT